MNKNFCYLEERDRVRIIHRIRERAKRRKNKRERDQKKAETHTDRMRFE